MAGNKQRGTNTWPRGDPEDKEQENRGISIEQKTKQNKKTIIQKSFPNIKKDLNYIMKEHTMYLRILTKNDQKYCF